MKDKKDKQIISMEEALKQHDLPAIVLKAEEPEIVTSLRDIDFKFGTKDNLKLDDISPI